MPHDRDGNPISKGDRVTIDAEIIELSPTETQCNATYRAIIPKGIDETFAPQFSGNTRLSRRLSAIRHNGSDDQRLTSGCGYVVSWQDGPVVDGKPNGAQAEDILRVAMARLETFQSGSLPSPFNEGAIHHIAAAIRTLEARTADRVDRGVEATMNP